MELTYSRAAQQRFLVCKRNYWWWRLSRYVAWCDAPLFNNSICEDESFKGMVFMRELGWLRYACKSVDAFINFYSIKFWDRVTVYGLSRLSLLVIFLCSIMCLKISFISGMVVSWTPVALIAGCTLLRGATFLSMTIVATVAVWCHIWLASIYDYMLLWKRE